MWIVAADSFFIGPDSVAPLSFLANKTRFVAAEDYLEVVYGKD
jgi:hypothetical protein